jgi:hypothetical protein
MARLIEIQAGQNLAEPLPVQVGDLLMFEASGGAVRSGAEVVELLGAFLKSVVGSNGAVLSPMGSANAVVFLARRPGQATIEVVCGDPWHGSTILPLPLLVLPADPGMA